MLTLANTTLENRKVEIELIDPNDGTLIAHKQRLVPAGKVQSLDVRHWISSRLQRADDGFLDLRLRLSIEGAGVLTSGWSRDSEGTVHDWAFFPRNQAHATGLYPLPPLAEYESITHLVNLGEENALVAAHVFWINGGSYAFGPVEIPAGTTRSLDWTQIAQQGSSDRSSPGCW